MIVNCLCSLCLAMLLTTLILNIFIGDIRYADKNKIVLIVLGVMGVTTLLMMGARGLDNRFFPGECIHKLTITHDKP